MRALRRFGQTFTLLLRETWIFVEEDGPHVAAALLYLAGITSLIWLVIMAVLMLVAAL